MSTPQTAIDVVEQAIIDEFAGRISQTEAVARVRAVLDVTQVGALDMLRHPAAPRRRYEQTNRGTR